MRIGHPARLPHHKTHLVHRYPTRSDRHPLYLFGHFDLDGEVPQRSYILDEALLGLREDPQPTALAHHRHSLQHAANAAQESRRFMFGVDPEQPQVTARGEPTYYFWAVGGG